jgi:hypothetical protein
MLPIRPVKNPKGQIKTAIKKKTLSSIFVAP